MQRAFAIARNVRRGHSRTQRHCLSIEQMEPRRMMFATYVGQGDPNGVWGTTNLSYSYSNFQDFAPGWADGLSRVDMQNAVEESMGIWTAVTPLRFFARVDSGPPPSETPYDAGSHPTIRWGHHFIDGQPTMPPFTNVLAHALRPGTGGLNGDPHFDDGNTWTINQIMETGAHEFGHAIGLAHPNGNVVGGVCPPAVPAIMDACAGSFSYNGLESAFLLPDDIAGIHSLYGTGLGYVIDGFGELNVYGGSGNDLLSVDFFGGNIIVSSSIVGGPFVGSFSRPINDGQTVVNSIQLHGLGGNDVLRVVNSNGLRVNAYGGAGDDIFDIGFASNNLNGIGESQYFAGAGNDSLFAYDGNNNSGATYSVTSTRFDRSGWAGTRFFDDLENRTLTTGNTANTVNVFNTSTNRPTTINNGGGTDIVNLGTSNSLQQIQGNVTIQNDPSFTTLNLNNSADTVARTISISQIAGNLGQLTGLAPGAILWDNADIAAINVTTGTGADAVNVFGISEVTLLANAGGRDTYNVGSGVNGLQGVTGNLTIRAFFGADSPMVLNDAASSIARNATMTAVGIDYTISGLAPANITYRDFGEVTVFQGGGSDTFNFNTNVFHRMEVFGLGGNDGFIWGAVNNYAEGLGGTFVSAVNLDGGTGYNSLSVNDTARTEPTTYQLHANRFISRDPIGFADGADFLYDNMNAIGITANNLANQFAVFGVSSDIDMFNQVSINLNGGNDILDIAPHDAAGNLTINGNLGVNGATGTDLMRIQDAGAINPINYSFSNPFGSGTQNVYGLGTSGLGTSTIETWVINAGHGDDTFAMNQFTSGIGLGINAGGGDDVLNFGGGYLPVNITSIASFSFNGETGYDRFHVDNDVDNGLWTYTRNVGTVTLVRPGVNLLTLSDANIEEMTLNAGPSADQFIVRAVSAGTSLVVNANGGADLLSLGDPTPSLSSIQGRVTYNAGATGGRAELFDTSDTTGDTFHLTPNTVGAFPGDNLFGTGGSLTFADLTDVNINAPALLIHLGSGSDTAYAQPLASGTATINFNAQNAPEGPDGLGDALNLALAAAANYVITGTSSGNVVSDTTGRLNWTGVELPLVVDDVAPMIVGLGYSESPFSTLAIEFSEDVGPSLAASLLELINTTTNVQVPFANMALIYDAGTNTANFTFPGNPDGLLVAGDYSALISSSLPDLFGNQFGVTSPLLFTVANHAPVADDDGPYDVAEGGTLDVTAPGVLEGDTDADGNPLAAVLVTGPANAANFTLNPDGSFSYVHDGSETTSDTFTYVASDGTDGSNLATVTILISPIDDSPLADASLSATTGIVNQPAALDGSASYDPEMQPLSYAWTVVSQPPGSTPLIGDPTAATTTFAADLAGVYEIELVVFDGVLFSLPTIASITLSNTPVVDGDFNDDGNYNLLDIDALVGEIAAATNNPSFDLTADGLVNLSDRDAWLAEAGGVNLGQGRVYRLGDANLDSVVDGSDFGIWNANKFTLVAAWSRADFDANGAVDGSDFGIWNANKFTSADAGRPASNSPASSTELAAHSISLRAKRVDELLEDFPKWSI